MLPKRPSDQSKTSSNYGRAAYSTHSLLTINSSTTSFFEISRSILIARDSTTKLMFDQLSIFFESCQVLCDQNSTFLLILRLLNARLQILIFTKSFAEETRVIGQELEEGRYAATERKFRSVAT